MADYRMEEILSVVSYRRSSAANSKIFNICHLLRRRPSLQNVNQRADYDVKSSKVPEGQYTISTRRSFRRIRPVSIGAILEKIIIVTLVSKQ